jgi:hypothetical protein
MPRVVAALTSLMVVLCFATASWGKQRVAVLQPDGELFRAISLALSPWDLQTIQSNAPVPQASQPEAVRAASRLTGELDVEALVWLTEVEQGSLLWVYDADTGDVTTRMIAESPPFDSAAAAAVALSVKTALRSSAVAPKDERFGSQPTPPKGDRLWAVELGAGGQWVNAKEVAFVGELGGVLWLPAARRLGFSLDLSYGPGLAVNQANFEGRYREFVAGAKTRFRVIHMPEFSALLLLGTSGHWSMLDGTLGVNSRKVDSNRLNGSIDVETAVNFKVSDSVYLGASIGGTYFLRYQRYLVDGDPVFSPRPWTVNFRGHCGFEIF